MLSSRKQKKWPKDFFISEIDEGFWVMEKMMSIRNGKTVEEAFSVAFPSIKFGKTLEWKDWKFYYDQTPNGLTMHIKSQASLFPLIVVSSTWDCLPPSGSHAGSGWEANTAVLSSALEVAENFM
jgi:hypothetical protein